jgi:hypothetical protein
LKKLDMSRCQLSEHGFFELIPIILKTEHVILQGNLIRHVAMASQILFKIVKLAFESVRTSSPVD